MKQDITIADLMARTQHVVGREVQVVRVQLLRNHIDLVPATGSVADAHTVLVEGKHVGDRRTVSGDNIVIATGTRPARPVPVAFDAARVIGIVSTTDRKLLGVHVFGTGATNLVHFGQVVMGCGGTVDHLVDAVFNYPTLSEAFKVAAVDATCFLGRGLRAPMPYRAGDLCLLRRCSSSVARLRVMGGDTPSSAT
ncbi:hypothetical protein ACWEOE_19825 [Amycolatopsis sp. NPDC004368]